MRATDWKKFKQEAMRDLIALGGIPFYLLVIARVFVGERLAPFYPLTCSFLIALAIIFLLSLLIKNNYRASLSLALLAFTSLNYKDMFYTVFAGIAWVLLMISLDYLKFKKWEIAKGIVIGAFASSIAYYLVNLVITI